MTDAEVDPSATLAVLLGASTFDQAPKLAQGPAFYNSAHDFREYLISQNGLQIPPQNVRSFFDDNRSPGDQLRNMGEFLRTRLAELKDNQVRVKNLIVYYVGHGLFCGTEQAYCLAIRGTEDENESITSIRVADLASVIRSQARWLRMFLILDSCFSAAAYKEFQSGPLSASRVKILAEFPNRGTALLCSASARDPARAPINLAHTMFSEALLNALKVGHESLGPRLSLSELGDLVTARLREMFPNNFVRPEVHSPDQREGNISDLEFFPNHAFQASRARDAAVYGDATRPALMQARTARENVPTESGLSPRTPDNIHPRAYESNLLTRVVHRTFSGLRLRTSTVSLVVSLIVLIAVGTSVLIRKRNVETTPPAAADTLHVSLPVPSSQPKTPIETPAPSKAKPVLSRDQRGVMLSDNKQAPINTAAPTPQNSQSDTANSHPLPVSGGAVATATAPAPTTPKPNLVTDSSNALFGMHVRVIHGSGFRGSSSLKGGIIAAGGFVDLEQRLDDQMPERTRILYRVDKLKEAQALQLLISSQVSNAELVLSDLPTEWPIRLEIGRSASQGQRPKP